MPIIPGPDLLFMSLSEVPLLSPCCLSPTKVIAVAIMYHIYMLALQAANRILGPQSGIESVPLAVEAES